MNIVFVQNEEFFIKVNAFKKTNKTLQAGSIKKFAKKSHLYLASSESTKLYRVRNGCFKTYHINDKVEEVISGFYFPGNIIGLDKLYKDEADFNVQATVDSDVVIFSEDSLYDNTFLRACLKQEVERERINALVLSASDTYSRAATFFLHFIDNVIDHPDKSKALYFPITFVDLSKYLSMTNENLSRILSDIKDDNTLVIKKGVIECYNRTNLEKLAGLKDSPNIMSID